MRVGETLQYSVSSIRMIGALAVGVKAVTDDLAANQILSYTTASQGELRTAATLNGSHTAYA